MNYHVIQLNLQRYLLICKYFLLFSLVYLNLLNMVKLDYLGEILLKNLNLED